MSLVRYAKHAKQLGIVASRLRADAASIARPTVPELAEVFANVEKFRNECPRIWAKRKDMEADRVTIADEFGRVSRQAVDKGKQMTNVCAKYQDLCGGILQALGEWDFSKLPWAVANSAEKGCSP